MGNIQERLTHIAGLMQSLRSLRFGKPPTQKGVSMPRVDLSVPFASKDVVKALGAKWDAVNRLWFVPDGVDPAPFSRWLLNSGTPEPNVRSNNFFIATAVDSCWKCSTPVNMVAFILPAEWEEWVEAVAVEDDELGDRWRSQPVDIILNNLDYVNATSLKAAQAINPNYKSTSNPSGKSKKYYNHCSACDFSQVGPNSGNSHVFKPETVERAKLLTVHRYDQYFECRSSSYSGLRCHGGANALDYMRRA